MALSSIRKLRVLIFEKYVLFDWKNGDLLNTISSYIKPTYYYK